MADVLPDGLVVLDGHATLVFCSARAGRLMDLDPEAILGRPVREVLALHDSDGRPWWDYADPWHTLHTVTGHREKLLWTTEGIELLVTARYLRKPLRSPVRRVLMSVRDASARQRAEQDHAALISTIAHELRSPLTSVKGFSATLLRGWEKFTDEQKRFMIETMETGRRPGVAAHHRAARRLPARRRPSRRPAPAGRPAGHGRAPRRAAQGWTGQPDDRFVVAVGDDLPEVWADPDRVNQILGTSWKTPCATGTALSPWGS